MSIADYFPYDTSTIPPPPGVKANFHNPVTRGYIIIIMGALLLALVFVFIAIRFYIKVFVAKTHNWGDCVYGTSHSKKRELTLSQSYVFLLQSVAFDYRYMADLAF